MPPKRKAESQEEDDNELIDGPTMERIASYQHQYVQSLTQLFKTECETKNLTNELSFRTDYYERNKELDEFKNLLQDTLQQ